MKIYVQIYITNSDVHSSFINSHHKKCEYIYLFI